MGILFFIVPLFKWVLWGLMQFLDSLYVQAYIRSSKRVYKHTFCENKSYFWRGLCLCQISLTVQNSSILSEIFSPKLSYSAWRVRQDRQLCRRGPGKRAETSGRSCSECSCILWLGVEEMYGTRSTEHCSICVSFQVSMVDAIPGLINTIKMIQSISQYYNTSEKISSLFVKVSAIVSERKFSRIFLCVYLCLSDRQKTERDQAIEKTAFWVIWIYKEFENVIKLL